jgi:hypothetical protein
MNKATILSFAAVLALMSTRSHAGSVTINLIADYLQTSGSIPVSDGMLVQLVGDTTSTFGAPTATSFTGTDPNEIVLWSGVVEAGQLGQAGSLSDPITLTLGALGAAENTGDYLMLRWYPTLSLSASTPGAGTSYGQFNNNGSATPDAASGSDIAWLIPASAASPYALNYFNTLEGGDEPVSAGVANLKVAAVPEPTTLALMVGSVAVGAMFLRRRR